MSEWLWRLTCWFLPTPAIVQCPRCYSILSAYAGVTTAGMWCPNCGWMRDHRELARGDHLDPPQDRRSEG